jgi:hypothetical protein
MDVDFILGALAKLRKATPYYLRSVHLSVRSYVRMEHLGSHWMHIEEIWYFSIFLNVFQEIQVLYLTRIIGTLQRRPIHMFDHISRSVPPVMRNVPDKVVEKIKPQNLCSIKSCCLGDSVGKIL